MPYHSPVTVDDVTYHLGHLDPVTFHTHSTKLCRDVITWCRFTTHSFSRSPQSGETPHVWDEGKRPRVLCPDRYRLSLHLPRAVEKLSDPRCYIWETASERNWLYEASVDVVDGNASTSYQVFFAVRKARRSDAYDIEMTVESAYAFDPARPPKLRGRMLIVGLLTTTVEGGKPHTKGSRKR